MRTLRWSNIFATVLVLVLFAAFAACDSREQNQEQPSPGSQAGKLSMSDIPKADPGRGADIYAEACSECHGEGGRGGFAPSHIGCDVCQEYKALYVKIEEDMPKGGVKECTGQCAADAAAYIFVTLNNQSL